MGITISHITELPGDQVVPAGPPDIVAILFEYSLEIGFGPVIMEHMVHGPVAPHMRVPAGHEAATGRGADRVLAEGPTERNGLCLDKAVQIGRSPGPVSQVTHCIGPHLVRVKKQDMWLFLHNEFSF